MLTIGGSSAQVDNDLATLTDTDRSPAADKITINASDSAARLTRHGAPQMQGPELMQEELRE